MNLKARKPEKGKRVWLIVLLVVIALVLVLTNRARGADSVTISKTGTVLNTTPVNFPAGKLRSDGATVLTTVPPLDPDLTAIAGLTTTPYGRSFLDRVDAAAARSLLGLGTLATQSGTFSGTSSNNNTGDQIVPATTAATANQWFSVYDATTGAFTKTQPAFGDLSGAATIAQLPTGITSATVALGNHAHTGVYVPTGTTITPSAPLSGGGALTGNLLLSMAPATNVADGYLTAADHTAFAGLLLSSEQAATNATTAWTTGAEVFTETEALTADRATALPRANTYPAGRIIYYVDAYTTGNFGRTFTPVTGDTFRGALPFKGGGLSGASVSKFKSNGSTLWQQIDTGWNLLEIRDPTDPSKVADFDNSGQPTGTRATVKVFGNSVMVIPTTSPTPGTQKRFVTAISANGTAPRDVVNSNDIVPTQFTAGNADATVTNDGTIDSFRLNTPLSAMRRFICPDVDTYAPGQPVRFYSSVDSGGNIARIISSSAYGSFGTTGNTFNGQPLLDISEPFFSRVFVADPANHNWAVSGGASGGAAGSNDPFHPVTPVSGVATIVCTNGVPENHHTVSMSTALTLAFSGCQPGTTGKIKLLDSAGAHVVTAPNGIGKTPTTEGTGAFTTSTGVNVEDLIGWTFDGTYYQIYPLARKLVAAASAGYTTTADTINGTTVGFFSQGNSTGAGRWFATKFVPATSYTLGKVRLRLTKTGSPTTTMHVAIYADSGAGTPGSLVGSASTGVLASSLPTSEGDVDFDTNAEVTAGGTYWVVYYADVISRSITDAVLNGTTTVTSATANFTSADVGATLASSGNIASGTYISSVTNSTTVVISAAASVSATGVPVTIGGGNVSNYTTWAYQTVTSTAANVSFNSSAGSTWFAGTNGTTRQCKYTTFKP